MGTLITGDEGKTELTSTRDGVLARKQSGKDMFEKERLKAEKAGDKVGVQKLSDEKVGDKQAYIEMIGKIQEMYKDKMELKKQQLQGAKSQKEVDTILAEVKEMGAFSRSLDEELKFLDGNKSTFLL